MATESKSSSFAAVPRPSSNASEGRRPGRWRWLRAFATTLCASVVSPLAIAAHAPPWIEALVSIPTPEHEENADSVVLYSETQLTVQANGRVRRLDRRAYRILRPDGAKRGVVAFSFTPTTPIVSLAAWGIPISGKDFSLKMRDAVETALPGIVNSMLVSDVRAKVLRIPAATPGSTIGYEIEQDLPPDTIDDRWNFQTDLPVHQSRYLLALPSGWRFRASWIHHAEVSPTEAGAGRWVWTVNDVPSVPTEVAMPPLQGIASRVEISLIPPSSNSQGSRSWQEIGSWYESLVRGRRDASSEIRAQVATVTAGLDNPLARIRAVARFVQRDVRYVAIELGIGGHQPHAAAEVFHNRYGDCKDKATLLASMLQEIGVQSYYVLINTTRGIVNPEVPPSLDFNHVVLAISLAPEIEDPSLIATLEHGKLGRLLVFDPTDPYTPLGGLAGPLQGNYGLLVFPEGGELIGLPQLAPATSGTRRTARMRLDEIGTLEGDVLETRIGDPAEGERERLANARRASDDIRLVEFLVADSIGNFTILKADVENRDAQDLPLVWRYSLRGRDYAKANGDLLLLRPRLLGTRGSGFLETAHVRREPIEFRGLEEDDDSFEFELPARYHVLDMPGPVDVDYRFASYHSHIEFDGHVLRYSRRFVIKQFSVPVAESAELKALYRTILADERRAIVLSHASP